MVELHDKQKQREETGLKGNIVDQLKPTSKITGNSNLYTSDAYHPTKKEMGRLVNLYSQGNFHEALIEGHVLVGKFPDNFIILNIIGAVYTGLNRYCKAIVSYKKAIELKPNFAEAYSNLGNTLNHLGKYQEAIISYKKAIELKANFAEVHYNLGEVLKRLGKLEEGEPRERGDCGVAAARAELGVLA